MESVDQRIAGVAAEQHNQVAVRQLVALGVSRDAILRRRRSGLLVPVHEGVLSLGRPARTLEEISMAAWLACGHETMVGGRQAAALYGARPLSDEEHRVVDVVTPRPRKRAGIHDIVREVPDRHRRLVRGIPVTSPARTAFDLGLLVDRYEQLMVANELQVLDLVTQDDLEAMLDEVQGQRGAAVFAEAIGLTKGGISRRWAEIRMAELLDGTDLPAPRRNHKPGGPFSGDFVWEDLMLVVEIDSVRYHRTAWARARDARKDAWFEQRNWIMKRVPALLVKHRPISAVAAVAEAVGIAAGTVEARRLGLAVAVAA